MGLDLPLLVVALTGAFRLLPLPCGQKYHLHLSFPQDRVACLHLGDAGQHDDGGGRYAASVLHGYHALSLAAGYCWAGCFPSVEHWEQTIFWMYQIPSWLHHHPCVGGAAQHQSALTGTDRQQVSVRPYMDYTAPYGFGGLAAA